MADRNAAEIFSTVFELLSENPTDERKAFAKQLWPSTRHYDFSDEQMECDSALIRLGLAYRDPHEGVVYAGDDGELA